MIRIYQPPPVLPAEEDIVSFESFLGIRLPEDYRSFLLTRNGGGVFPPDDDAEYNLFQCWDPFPRSVGETDPLSLMFSLEKVNAVVEDPLTGLRDMYTRIISPLYSNLPKFILPIGETLNAWMVCMFVDESRLGEIFLWIENYPGEYGERRIAKSFGEFETGVYQKKCSERE